MIVCLDPCLDPGRCFRIMYHAAVLTMPSAAASLYRSFAAVNVNMDKFDSIPELEQYLKHLDPDYARSAEGLWRGGAST